MNYTIRAFRTGQLVLRGNHAFEGGDPEAGVPYAMYVWLILGGPQPILVDTGPKSVEEINRGLGDMCIQPVTRRPGEDIGGILASAGVHPLQVRHVFFTHLHYDHCSNADLFPNAKLVVDAAGYREALRRLDLGTCWVPGEIIFPMRDQWQDRLILAEDSEILPGIRTIHLGGHTPCSMAVAVSTARGTAVITGDPVSLYENIERGVPVGVYEDRAAILAAMDRVRREADIVLPAHDPEVLIRHPGGIIG